MLINLIENEKKNYEFEENLMIFDFKTMKSSNLS